MTVERFMEWNAKFLKEMKILKDAEEKRKADLGPAKLTGRQLFEQNKVLASSDSAYFEAAGDEAVFEGLEDLQIEDEDDLNGEDLNVSSSDDGNNQD